LLRLFGGGEGLTPAAPKSPTASVPAAPTARAVESTGLTKLTSKKDREADDFLFGAASKKKQPKAKPTTSKPTTKPKGFVLSMDVMRTLGELGVALPTSDEDVKNTVEELKTKLTHYKENQVRVTQEVHPPFVDGVKFRILPRQIKIMKILNANRWQYSLRKKKQIYLGKRMLAGVLGGNHLQLSARGREKKELMEMILKIRLRRMVRLLWRWWMGERKRRRLRRDMFGMSIAFNYFILFRRQHGYVIWSVFSDP
jgi:hypothetical protein